MALSIDREPAPRTEVSWTPCPDCSTGAPRLGPLGLPNGDRGLPPWRTPDPRTSGEVVVSNLVNRETVLLNYRLGDVAASLPDRCPCGRSLPLLSPRRAARTT
jgi:hypothetical protein